MLKIPSSNRINSRNKNHLLLHIFRNKSVFYIIIKKIQIDIFGIMRPELPACSGPMVSDEYYLTKLDHFCFNVVMGMSCPKFQSIFI